MLSHQSKDTIIVSCNLLDAALASTLYRRGYKVMMLNEDRENFRYLPEEFGGSELEGDPTDPRVLREARIKRIGMIIAAAQDDNSNLLTSRVVNNIFQVGRVYARLGDTNRYRLIAGVSIQPVSLYNLSAGDYRDLADSVNQEVAV